MARPTCLVLLVALSLGGCYIMPNIEEESRVELKPDHREPNAHTAIGAWQAINLQGWAVPKAQYIVIRFRQDGSMQASANCNFMFSQYTIKGGRVVRHGDLAQTARACEGPNEKAEKRLSANILATHSWTIAGTNLTARDRSGRVIATFKRQPDETKTGAIQLLQ